MFHPLRILITAAIAANFVLTSGPTVASEATNAQTAKHKINLSGRQRMLTQRIAKSICFATVSVDKDRHMDVLADAYELFEKTLNGLRQGDPDLELTREDAPAVLTELSKSDALWEIFGRSVENALADETSLERSLWQVAEFNMPMLQQMDRTVVAFETHYGGSSAVSVELAHAINLAGRQRMLSQKASKEFCFVMAGLYPDENRAALRETIALFDATLDGLTEGSEEMQLNPAPSSEIRDQLDLVKSYWGPMRAIFLKAANGEEPSKIDIQRVALDTTTILFEMNRAVTMYERF